MKKNIGATLALYPCPLIVVGAMVADKIEAPSFNPPALFGRECVDKVTGIHGMCIGRTVSLFSGPQYILEIQPEDHEKPSRYEWLDEGRLEPAEHPTREIDPETVKGDRPGSGFPPEFISFI